MKQNVQIDTIILATRNAVVLDSLSDFPSDFANKIIYTHPGIFVYAFLKYSYPVSYKIRVDTHQYGQVVILFSATSLKVTLKISFLFRPMSIV